MFHYKILKFINNKIDSLVHSRKIDCFYEILPHNFEPNDQVKSLRLIINTDIESYKFIDNSNHYGLIIYKNDLYKSNEITIRVVDIIIPYHKNIFIQIFFLIRVYYFIKQFSK